MRTLSYAIGYGIIILYYYQQRRYPEHDRAEYKKALDVTDIFELF